jgi:hypothetical protein
MARVNCRHGTAVCTRGQSLNAYAIEARFPQIETLCWYRLYDEAPDRQEHHAELDERVPHMDWRPEAGLASVRASFAWSGPSGVRGCRHPPTG